jgi:hypothetical protein
MKRSASGFWNEIIMGFIYLVLGGGFIDCVS